MCGALHLPPTRLRGIHRTQLIFNFISSVQPVLHAAFLQQDMLLTVERKQRSVPE